MALTNCPRCHSEQGFPIKQRQLPANSHIDRFIVCKMCGWELMLSQTTDEIEILANRYIALNKRAAFEKNRHGQATNTTIRRRVEVGEKWMEARRKLDADMKVIHDSGMPADDPSARADCPHS